MTRRLAIVAVAAVALAGCGGDEPAPQTRTVTTEKTQVEVVGKSAATGGSFDPARIYANEAPGVVTIYSVSGSVLTGGDSGQGSGFVLDGDGEIVTNAHVVTRGEDDSVEEVDEVFVEFSDGNRVEAKIRGYDPDADVALLEIDPEGLQLRPLPLGDSDAVEVGEPVAAIGSPFGERQSLSVGIVSAVDRDSESLTRFSIPGVIQTDAAINPGNSGGPLVNAEGEVIGINQSIESQSGSGAGVGFAVPSDLIKRSVDQLRKNGEVRYGYMGVETTPVYPQLAERFDLPVETGAWIQGVVPGGPSDDAGLREGAGQEEIFQASQVTDGGDIITKLGDFDIVGPNDLGEAVARLDPGQKVPVVVYRDGERRTIELTLGDRSEDG